MSKIIAAGVAALGLMTAQAAFAQPPAAAPAPAAAGALSSKTPLKALMANPKAKEVLAKHIPQVVEFLDGGGGDQIPDDFTVDSLLDIAEAGVSADMVKAINDDLAKL